MAFERYPYKCIASLYYDDAEDKLVYNCLATMFPFCRPEVKKKLNSSSNVQLCGAIKTACQLLGPEMRVNVK